MARERSKRKEVRKLVSSYFAGQRKLWIKHRKIAKATKKRANKQTVHGQLKSCMLQ